MERPSRFPIDRVLFETTEFCENQCYFCYGDYGPEGEHMSSEAFSLYLKNLIEADLLAPDSLLILFGGEMLNHPECLEICRIASELKQPSMHLVIITSGKFREEFKEQVEELSNRSGLIHHWEISIKDMESFRFGIRLLKKGNEALFRYDYLGSTGLKSCIKSFFRHVKTQGIWKEFKRRNPSLEKDLRYVRKHIQSNPDTVIVEEFFFAEGNGKGRSVGLTFSPLDRSVLRRGGVEAKAECSLFHPQYGTAIHVTRDGSIYPCHLPRFKKRCERLGNAADPDFLRQYSLKIEEFRRLLADWQRGAYSVSGICLDGCRGRVCLDQ